MNIIDSFQNTQNYRATISEHFLGNGNPKQSFSFAIWSCHEHQNFIRTKNLVIQPKMTNDNEKQGDSSAYKASKVKNATRNPYLNFMKEFRLKNKNMNVVEQTVKGAEMWRKMNDSQKAPFVELARQARRRRKKGGKGRRRRRGRRHSMDSDY